MENSGRVFISHASEDKLPHIRPLVEALLYEGVQVWLDRPGVGTGNFGFERSFIDAHGITGLVAGQDFDEQILHAHRSCGAVLACLSRALCSSRQVLVQELALGRYANKLVTCMVDDLPYDQLPPDLGLLNASRLQSPRIDTTLLRQAVDCLNANPKLSPNKLPRPLFTQWEIVRQIVADIQRVLRTSVGTKVSAMDLEKVRIELRSIPVGPMVRVFEIPSALIGLLAERFDSPEGARRHFNLAMQLALACGDPRHTEKQTVVSKGEIIPPERNAALDYWTDVVAVAGQKSRRTLAALFLAPGSAPLCNPADSVASELQAFLEWLRAPDLKLNPIQRS